MSTGSVYYNGTKPLKVKNGEREFALDSVERETLTMTMEPAEYMPRAVEYCLFASRSCPQ